MAPKTWLHIIIVLKVLAAAANAALECNEQVRAAWQARLDFAMQQQDEPVQISQ